MGKAAPLASSATVRAGAGAQQPAGPALGAAGLRGWPFSPGRVRTLTGTRGPPWSGLSSKLTDWSSTIVPDLTKKVLWRYLQGKTKTEGVGSASSVAAAATV